MLLVHFFEKLAFGGGGGICMSIHWTIIITDSSISEGGKISDKVGRAASSDPKRIDNNRD